MQWIVMAAAEAEKFYLGFVLGVVGEVVGPVVERFVAVHEGGDQERELVKLYEVAGSELAI